MGLISGLLTLPLAPVRGVVWVAEQLETAAEDQLYDEARIRRELRELETRLEAGELSEAEFEAAEDELLDLLTQAQTRHREVDREI